AATLNASSAGSVFVLTTNGSVNLSNITAGNGSIVVNCLGSLLQTLPNVGISATGAAITLETNKFTPTSSLGNILIGRGDFIHTQGL
ncbi:hypothetical protein, partial [Klebsiella pneumoniae]|uniref:hypothetical protein n=1 Tax=Klebsiella pneumoniae TaxID=573 RepID=UPI003CF95E6A